MQRLAIKFCVSLVTFIVGVTAATFGPSTNDTDKQQILLIEREYKQAHVERDTATLDRILADDFTFIDSCGKLSDKAKRLALINNPDLSFISITTDDVEVNIVGDRAFVQGKAITTSSDKYHEITLGPYPYMRIYEKRYGQWQIVSARVMRAD